MAGLSDYAAQAILAHVVGKTSFTMPSTWLALFTVQPIDAGTGGTEVTGGGYARVATSGLWGAASGSDPSTITNTGAITFATSTGSWSSGSAVVGFGLYDASSAGNLLFSDYLGNFTWNPFTCTLASPGVLTVPAHGYSNGDSVIVASEFGGTLPATAGSWTGTKTVAGVTTDTFTAGVNTTGTGSGLVRKVSTQVVNASGIQVSFAASALILTLT